MATFDFTPDYAPVKSSKPNVTKVKFGDGYEQRFAKGLNSDPKTWSLQFNNRDTTEKEAIEAFLDARGGLEAFDWTPPLEDDAIRVKCEEWNTTLGIGNFYSVTATFIQVFEP